MEQQFPNSDPNVAVSCIAYVRYDPGMLDGQPQAFHNDNCIPLSNYKVITEMLVSTDMVEDKDGFLLFPGELDPLIDLKVQSEEAKKLARTLLKGLRRNELNGVCLGDFTAKNVWVSPYGKAKIKGVQVMRSLAKTELYAQLRKNHLSTALIIRGLFAGGTIPDDIAHLLDLIENRFEDRELYHVHASLTPLANYTTLYKDLYDHLISALTKYELRCILDNLWTELPEYLRDWKPSVAGKYLLKTTFDRNKNGYSVPADKFTVNEVTQKQTPQIRLWKDQIGALKSVGIVAPTNQKTLTQNEKNWIESLLFLEYLRNRTSHRLEPMERFMVAQNGRNYKYTGEGSERICQARFPKVVFSAISNI